MEHQEADIMDRTEDHLRPVPSKPSIDEELVGEPGNDSILDVSLFKYSSRKTDKTTAIPRGGIFFFSLVAISGTRTPTLSIKSSGFGMLIRNAKETKNRRGDCQAAF